MDKDLQKIRIENLKLEKAVKKAQENLAIHGKNQNNTSS
jgi:trimethylamine:corrinoid methyltransferase-like protein